MEPRKAYPTDVSDEEWAFVVPNLKLMTPDAPQREHKLREVLNAVRWIARTGAPWRYLPNAFLQLRGNLLVALSCCSPLCGGALLCLHCALPSAGQRL
jgi:hypothetical protein